MSLSSRRCLVTALKFAITSVAIVGAVQAALNYMAGPGLASGRRVPVAYQTPNASRPSLGFRPRQPLDNSGLGLILDEVAPWGPDASLETLRQAFQGVGQRAIARLDARLSNPNLREETRMTDLVTRAIFLNSDGQADRSYEDLSQVRSLVERNERVAVANLYRLIFAQGVAALRKGETDNCVMCRGASSCILPISPAAVHAKPAGSRLAIKHFTEYLERFPYDLEARWLLNVAQMTLGEYPNRVDPRYLVSLDRFQKDEFNIGKFHDIGHLLGVNRLNQAGGAIMEDFDGDGRLDLVVTSFDATQQMSFYHNTGDGTYEERSETAGLNGQYGGLVCYQTDYNNDGHMDVFIARGAWLRQPIRPSLLRNNGDGTFSDVTKEAGLLDPVNSNGACWADYDNDGFLDLFIACERQTNRLYHNQGDGTFREVARSAGVAEDATKFGKGATWIDYDNDDFPDLFVNHLEAPATLYHNNHNGTFSDVTEAMDITGPDHGFSCWAWDYNNDGWLDIFATNYSRTLGDVVKGLIGEPSSMQPGKLYQNRRGKTFVDQTEEAGLNLVFAAMGSNFADLDNDGFLDFYLGTGEPDLATLVPNRMFKGVEGKRFSEITATSGTGHLQKGHAIACGDWDRDGDIDIFCQMGGAVNGDKYHNILFQNPGQGNHSLGVKLVGRKTNRAAIGARIKVVTAGPSPMTIHRHVSSGSSFGANPLQQTIGLAKAEKVETLEIHWPTSGATQILHDIAANQVIEITESEPGYRKLDSSPIPTPK